MITAETVNRILKFHGDGLPVVSLYGRIDPGAGRREVHTRMMSLLDQVRPLAKDQTLERQSRLSVRADIERIKEAVDSNRWPPGAVVIFSCSGRDLYEEVPLPRRVREQVIVDATPFARPMLALLAPGVVCDESRWLAASGDICPVCRNPTRRTPDVIDELVAVVIDEGGSARHVEPDTKLSEYLVAAELRFPLPPSAVSP